MSRRPAALLLAAPAAIWLGLFFVVPMFLMGIVSLESGSLETGFAFTWEFSNFGDALSEHQEEFVRSFVYGGVATLLALLIAYPLAYAIALRAGRWRRRPAVRGDRALLHHLPDPDPGVADDPLGPERGRRLPRLARAARAPPTGCSTRPASVIAGLTYNFLPFMILPIYATLERLDVRLIEAANDLYASARAAFWKVTLPLSAPGIVAGMLLTFIPAVGDYVNAYFLGGPNQAMIGNVIQGQYLQLANYPIAAALSFVLMALIMVVVVIYLWRVGVGALMGDGEERSDGRARATRRRPGAGPRGVRLDPRARARGVRRRRGRLHADPDRGHRPVLVQRPERATSTSPGRGSRSTTGATPSATRRSRTRWSRA